MGGSRVRSIIGACLALFALVSMPADAQEAKRLALVFGNDGYTRINPLQKARNDARSVAQTLTGLGFQVLLTLDADRSTMAERLSHFENLVAPGDTAFFFFAGHGVAVDGANYLLPVDMPNLGAEAKNRVKDEGFMADSVAARLKERGARVAILVLDACRDNPFKSAGRNAFGLSRGLSVQPISGEGIFVLYSAGLNQAALDRLNDQDSNPNSVFTRHFISLVSQPGLSLVSVAKSLQAQIPDLAKSVGHEQMPSYYDQVRGDVFLAGQPSGVSALTQPIQPLPIPVPPVVPTPRPDDSAARLERAWKQTRDVNTCSAYQAFAREFPTSFEARLARGFIDETCRAASAPVQPAPLPTSPQPRPNPAPTWTPKSGNWLVIAGSYAQSERSKAQARLDLLRNSGIAATLIQSSAYPNLTPNLIVVGLGPYTRADANRLLADVKRHVRDAYVKAGF